jgi:molybdopterin synthase catalytic subunit
VLRPGDELALIPPVSGGAIHADPLSVDALHRACATRAPGAVVTFSGVTREVDFLDYEAYAEMAAEQIDGSSPTRSSATGSAGPRPSTASAGCALGEPSVSWPPARRTATRRSRARARSSTRSRRGSPIWKREEGDGFIPL